MTDYKPNEENVTSPSANKKVFSYCDDDGKPVHKAKETFKKEMRRAPKEPYCCTQFLEHYNRKYAKSKGSMKLEHDPGNEMYIDYARKKLHIVAITTNISQI